MRIFYECKNSEQSHAFRRETNLKDVINVYTFDQKLRLLAMSAAEQIEIAARAIISDTMSIDHGSHWFLDSSNFLESFEHRKFLGDLDKMIDKAKGKQPFIDHYYNKYNCPKTPPSWMIFEIMSFGTISTIYNKILLKDRKAIARQFGFHYKFMSSWLHSVTALRNLCAHHARLWNRSFSVSPKRPKNLKQDLVDKDKTFYAQAVVLKILLDKITGHSCWAEQLKQLFCEFPDIPLKPMGFEKGWDQTELWNA